MIIAEMNRIASHLVGMGAYGLDLGTFSPFLYAFREREMILDLFEEVCGARLTYSYLTVGGAHDDLPARLAAEVRGVSRPASSRCIAEYHTLLTTNRSSSSGPPASASCRRRWRSTTAAPARCCAAAASITICAATAKSATPRCTTATPSKSSCERNGHYPKDHDYPPVPQEAVLGDCWHRFYVRMLEVVQAIDLVPAGDRPLQHGHRHATASRSSSPQKLPKGEAYLETEGPARPDGLLHRQRRQRRSPGASGPAAAASAICRSPHELCRGCLIADVPAIVGSLDIVMGEIDR